MKLSEAIREGAKLRPQCASAMFRQSDFTDGVLCSCALGAAYEATFKEVPYMGGDINDDALLKAMRSLRKEYPELSLYSSVYDLIHDSALSVAIANWNDVDGLTREAIADRLAELGY